jgi:hypothetical protein
MINTELYELAHGNIPSEIQENINDLEKYFQTKREHVTQISILPNFCLDKDMTNFVHKVYPESKDYNIYRGLLCELRQNYPISAADIQFIYPQLLKQRGVVELPAGFKIETAIARIKDVQEMDLMDVTKKITNKNEMLLSPLYNNISIYEKNAVDNTWGTSTKKYYLGYDLSCDKFVLNFWHYAVIENASNMTISQFYNTILQTKIEGETVQTLVNEMCKGLVEYITGKNEGELHFLNDITTNNILQKDKDYFVFNHCVNLLGLAGRPMLVETTKLAGLKVYKSLVNNNHPFSYAFPYDAGFVREYHSHEGMTQLQRDRLEHTFYWNKTKAPFNTNLLTKVHSLSTDRFRQIETKLQVIPEGFLSTVFSRLSSHDVYEFLDAEDIILLQPGDKQTKIGFPLSSNHIITRLLFDNYDQFQHLNIINPAYYNKATKRLELPRQLAKLTLSFQ